MLKRYPRCSPFCGRVHGGQELKASSHGHEGMEDQTHKSVWFIWEKEEIRLVGTVLVLQAGGSDFIPRTHIKNSGDTSL